MLCYCLEPNGRKKKMKLISITRYLGHGALCKGCPAAGRDLLYRRIRTSRLYRSGDLHETTWKSQSKTQRLECWHRQQWRFRQWEINKYGAWRRSLFALPELDEAEWNLGELNSRRLRVSGLLYDASGGPAPAVIAHGLLAAYTYPPSVYSIGRFRT